MQADDLEPELLSKLIEWRHDIHQHPEMAFNEHRTAALVADVLEKAGFAVTRGVATTGVVATRDFGPGPSIGLRADMDALPISESTDRPYASEHSGIMHACGHDGHTVMLLGAALSLAERRDLSGTLHCVFQPAEENEAGAKAMIEADVLQRFPMDSIYALHNMPGLPVGRALIQSGAVLASFDRFDIQIEGEGGHGAFPEQTQDTILAAAQLITQLYSVVPRITSATDPTVLSVGHCVANGAYNVIPGQVSLAGSLRTFDASVRIAVREQIEKICKGIELTFGVRVQFDFLDGYPAVINDEACTELMAAALHKALGVQAVGTEFTPLMGSEDFAFFLEKRPGCFFLLGNGEASAGIHTPEYDFNDSAIAHGVSAFVNIAEICLARHAAETS